MEEMFAHRRPCLHGPMMRTRSFLLDDVITQAKKSNRLIITVIQLFSS